MKRQQLFDSFYLASTVAVLATQPAWADSMQVNAVQLNPTGSGLEVILDTLKNTSPPVFTSRYGKTLIADIINTQLRDPQSNIFHASNPTDGIAGVTVTPLNAKSIRVAVTGKAGVPVGKMVQSDRGLVLKLTTSSDTSLTQAQSRPSKSDQLQTTSIVSQQPPQGTGANIRTNQTPAPSYLNPSPNPLQFPTQPEDVRIQGTQPITLQQAFELARRNNRQLQVAELTLERSRAALREAQAALYPTLSVGVGINNQEGTSTNGLSLGGTNLQQPNLQPNLQPGTPTNTQTDAQQNVQTTGTTPDATTGTTPDATTGTTPDATTGTTPDATTGTTPDATTGTTPDATTGTTPDTTTGTTPGTTTLSDTGGRATSLSGSVSLNYNLYNSGERRASIRAAEEQVRNDELDVERLAEQIRLDVSNDYYNLQGADEQVRINQAAVTNAQASLRDAQALEQAGVGTRFDVLRSQVQLANATQNLTNSQSQQQIARRQLVTRLSLGQLVNVIAGEPVEIAGLWNPTLEESIVLAFQNRAELQQQLAQRNIFQQRRRIALAQLGPQVGLTASYNVGSYDIFDNERDDLSDEYSLGANVSLNLFDGGAARARARQEEANIAAAETSFADQRNQIRFEVEQAYSELQSNLANIQTASVALEQARESLRLARLRFQAGVGTQTDVINAENDLTSAEGNRVTAILEYNRALASLQRAISSGQGL